VVQSPAATRALAGVPSYDVAAVRPGQSVRLVVQAQPFAVWHGRVERVAERPQPNRPEDGADAAATDAHERYHVVEIALDEIATADIARERASAALRPGMCGTVRIETYRTTLGELLTRAWRQWWNLI
jgi:multidrug resistance efflux pump